MAERGRAARLLNLRPGESRAVGLASTASFVAFGGLMIGGSAIEALFFARYGVSKLPTMYLALGVTMFVVSVGLAALLSRGRSGAACIVIPLGLTVIVVLGRLAFAGGVSWSTQALWLVQGAAQFLVGWAVWALAGLVADTRQAKRFFPIIGAAGVLGYVLGGLVTRPLAAAMGTPNLILVWAGSLVVVAGVGARILAGGTSAHRRRHLGRRRREVGAFAQLEEGLRYVRRSPLLRWMAIGSITFSLLFFSLYLPFNRAAAVRFPDPDDLAGFFGVFFGLSTGLAFVLSLLVTNRLLARFGVPTVLLVLPLLYVAAFGTLSITATFVLLAAFRFVQVAWLQGGALSSWEAVVNTVPADRRDQTRAFLNGGPTQVGTILAGIVALVGEGAVSPSVLYAIGLAVALVATWAMLGARRAYPRALVDALREGRPSVFDAPASGSAPFAAGADRSAVDIAIAAVADPDVSTRRVATHLLGVVEGTEARTALLGALADTDAEVRATALASLGRTGGGGDGDGDGDGESSPVTDAACSMLADPDHTVRARASELLLRSAEAAEGARELRALAADPDPDVRATALRALGRSRDPRGFDLALAALSDAAPRVRAEAARSLALLDPSRALEPLAGALTEPNLAARAGIADALGMIGAQAVRPVARRLEEPGAVAGALEALGRLPVEGAAPDLRRLASDSVRRAVEDHRLGASLDGGDDRRALLRDSLLARADRVAIEALRAASLLDGEPAMGVAVDNLSVTDPAQRANALEVIETVGAKDLVRPLLAMWDADPAGDEPEALIARLRDSDDGWIRACAVLASAGATEPATADPEGGTMTRTLDTLSTMERVLFLRKVPLFAALPPPDLEPIARIATEHAYMRGDTIAEQGEVGNVMHIIVEGSVDVIAYGSAGGSRRLAVRSSGEVVGEMAVLTNEPRVADLVATSDVRLLSIDRRRFESILRERPETSLGVIRVLCARLAESDAAEPAA